MNNILGIRREDKNRWEKRVPIIPEHIGILKQKKGIQTIIQPSPIRSIKEDEYKKAGAKVQENLSDSSVIFAVKEIPINFFESRKAYAFFSHTIKGQKYNMPMLKVMMEKNCTLIDYEKIVDKKGRRLVFFGKFAGIAGMIDSLWALGQRCLVKKIPNPFSQIKQTIYYDGLDDAKKHIGEICKKIQKEGLPFELTPFIVGFAGYGNVSKGAQEIIDLFPIKEINPDQLDSVFKNPSNKVVYKVVFKEEDMVEPINNKDMFNLQEYYNQPEKYQGVFERYVPFLNVLMNCIYWDKRYPRLVTKDFLKNNYENLNLHVIGDISVDINGAIEFTMKSTSQDSPVFVYNPFTDKIEDGFAGEGIAVIAVDNLPCELPRESSREFSNSLIDFIPDIVKADYSVEFEKLDLPFEIKNAVILHKGKLTPDYQYINKYL